MSFSSLRHRSQFRIRGLLSGDPPRLSRDSYVFSRIPLLDATSKTRGGGTEEEEEEEEGREIFEIGVEIQRAIRVDRVDGEISSARARISVTLR